MKALFDFISTYCPYCGKDMGITSKFAKDDYYAHASFSCSSCGLHYQLADKSHILDAAVKSGGDMKYHAEMEH